MKKSNNNNKRRTNSKSSNNNKSNNKTYSYSKSNKRFQKKINSDTENNMDNIKEVENDLSWYIIDPSLFNGVAQFNWFNVLGRPISDLSESFGGASKFKKAAAGIMRIDYIPTPGISTNNNSPINKSMDRMLSMLNARSGRNTNYDAADLACYMFAAVNMVEWFTLTRRAFGAVRKFFFKNEYTPTALFSAMHLSYESFRDGSSMAELVNAYNTLAWEFNQNVLLPEGFTAYNKFEELNRGVFVDNTNQESQWYIYMPEVLYQYDDAGPNGTRCVPIPLGESIIPKDSKPFPESNDEQFGDHQYYGSAAIEQTVTSWITLGRSMLNALIHSSDVKMMISDLLRVYADWPVITVPEMSYAEDLHIQLAADYTFDQIANLRWLPKAKIVDADNTTHGKWYPIIDQNPDINYGNIEFRYITQWADTVTGPNRAAELEYLLGDIFLNTHVADPGLDYIVEATRNVITLKENGIITGGLEVTSCNCDLVTGISIYQRYFDTEDGVYRYNVIDYDSNVIRNDFNAGSTISPQDGLIKVYLMETFNNHPMMVNVPDSLSRTPELLRQTCFFTDLDNFTSYPQSKMKMINEVCNLGTYACPGWNYLTSRPDPKLRISQR